MAAFVTGPHSLAPWSEHGIFQILSDMSHFRGSEQEVAFNSVLGKLQAPSSTFCEHLLVRLGSVTTPSSSHPSMMPPCPVSQLPPLFVALFPSLFPLAEP